MRIFHHISTIAQIYEPRSPLLCCMVWDELSKDPQFTRLTYGARWSYSFIICHAIDMLYDGTFTVDAIKRLWPDITQSYYEQYTCQKIGDTWYITDDFDVVVCGIDLWQGTTLSLQQYRLVCKKIRHNCGVSKDFIVRVQ